MSKSLRDFIFNSKAYQEVITHRKTCSKWPKTINPETFELDGGYCLMCFGGGLTKFTETILLEFINSRQSQDIHFTSKTFVKAANNHNKNKETAT